MLEDDFPPDVVDFLKQELRIFSKKCYYNDRLKKIVYHNDKQAMEVYMFFQCREMEKHKYLESQKIGYDLGDLAMLEWDKSYAPDFCRFWKKTHVFISSKCDSGCNLKAG